MAEAQQDGRALSWGQEPASRPEKLSEPAAQRDARCPACTRSLSRPRVQPELSSNQGRRSLQLASPCGREEADGF